MKFIIAALCFAVCAGLVLGEICTVNTDCVSTQCNTNNILICQHPSNEVVTDGGLCTCQDSSTQGECVTASDCYGSNANLNCPDNSRHCYDNQCICDRFPIGRRSLLV